MVGNGRIAIAHGADQDIVLIDPDGSAPSPLVDRHGASQPYALDMAWSPDGSMLAYTDVRDDGMDGLFVLDVATGNVLDLSEGFADAAQPAWSPDGSRIAFTGFDGATGYDIYVIGADGTGRVPITAEADNGVDVAHMPAWSPDGARIAFAFDRYDEATETEDHGIVVIDASGGNEIRLTNSLDEQPVWSRDGSKIAFLRKTNDAIELYVVNADGSGERRISAEGITTSLPSWSPDGSQLLFGARDLETSNAGIVGVDVENGDSRTLIEDAYAALPVWSPDGSRIVFVRDDAGRPLPRVSLWVMRPDGSDLIELADELDGVSGVAWQPLPIPAEDPEPLPPADPTIAASIPVGPQGNTSAILYAERSVWVTASFVDGGGGIDRSMLFRVDASTNEIVAEIPLEGAPTFVSGGGGLAYGFGSVWVAGYGRVDGSLQAIAQRVDPTSNAVTATIPLGGTHGADIAVDEISVWAAYFGDDHAGVARIDPATNSVIAETALPSSYVRRITAAGRGVVATELEWTGNEGPCAVLTAIDPDTATILAREPVGAGCGGADLFVWNDEIWASAAGLQRVDPSTAQLVGESISFEPERFPRSFVLATGWEVWFGAYPGGNGVRPDRLARLDPATGVIEYFIEAGGTDAVFAPETRTIWILEFDGSLTRIDLNDR